MSDGINEEHLGEYVPASKAPPANEQVKDKIKKLWLLLEHIITACPTCQHRQKVQTTKSVTCLKCGHKYKIYPSNDISRVVSVPTGKLWILHEIRSLEISGKYTAIL